MKHKLISLAAAVCIILVAAVPGFGASACGDSPKQFVSNRAGAGFLYNIHSTANSNNYGNGDSTNKVSQNSNLSANAQEVIKLVNKERNAAGLSALAENSRLSEVAQAKAEEAVAASVKRAKSEGILADFLNKYATEVEGMLTGITVEKYGEAMKKEGFEDGRAAEKLEMAKALKVKGVSIDIIAETSGLPVEEIEKL
ncbi:MAG: hypothetical protein UEP31_01820 [Anaerovoracaceae bacterium]|nr:hypothetical protein [Anaerovoracaceae bacterium]